MCCRRHSEFDEDGRKSRNDVHQHCGSWGSGTAHVWADPEWEQGKGDWSYCEHHWADGHGGAGQYQCTGIIIADMNTIQNIIQCSKDTLFVCPEVHGSDECSFRNVQAHFVILCEEHYSIFKSLFLRRKITLWFGQLGLLDCSFIGWIQT